jgi:hypothetical protein
MTTWHSKDVGDGVEAFEPTSKLHEAFFAFAVAKGRDLPATIGIFSRYDLRANVVTWYFSPEASLLAQAFHAVPCEKPVPESGFGLSAGDVRSWEAHFPGYVPSRR